MSVYNLKSNRMLCWDDFLIDTKTNAEVRMHKPIKRNMVLDANKQWEGNHCGYAGVMKCKDKYRFYYNAHNIIYKPDGSVNSAKSCKCLCESDDGKNFKRAKINRIHYNGITNNNIFLEEQRDNFSVFYDENPNCPENERYKALAMGGGNGYPQDNGPHGLYMFVSSDGVDFKNKGRLNIPGSFDSYNVMMWDKKTEQYYFFYRSEYRIGGGDIEFDVVKKERTIFRTINVSTSKDLVNFEHLGELDYGKDNIPMQFYTNQILRYYRADDMFIGFPARYIDRWEEPENFEQMPLAERHAYMTKYHGREGTVVTDCGILTSRDGYHFNKWDEAYLTSGIEASGNWHYGDCYTVYGLWETESDTEGAPNEISFISTERNATKSNEFYRYTTRLDGFFSWYAKFRGGEILTKPFTFQGSELEINFSTSAFGDATVTVCDENGNELEGYGSIRIFGDSVKRIVRFEKDLKELEGKPIRLKFYLKDCDLYSFKFN